MLPCANKYIGIIASSNKSVDVGIMVVYNNIESTNNVTLSPESLCLVKTYWLTRPVYAKQITHNEFKVFKKLKQLFIYINIAYETRKTKNGSRPKMSLSHGESGSWKESFTDERHAGELPHWGTFFTVELVFSICNTVHNIQAYQTDI